METLVLILVTMLTTPTTTTTTTQSEEKVIKVHNGTVDDINSLIR